MTDDLIALIVRETGWTLEYIREQPLFYLYSLVEEIQYLRTQESYNHAYNAALIVCALVSSRIRRYKPHDIIGERPERRDMAKGKLSKEPTIHAVKLLDGKEYKLPILNLNVLADLEEEFGCGLEEISNLLQARQASSLRKTLYALLCRGYPEITQGTIGELVDLSNLEEVAGIVAKVLSGE